jgi:hypothetical protein
MENANLLRKSGADCRKSKRVVAVGGEVMFMHTCSTGDAAIPSLSITHLSFLLLSGCPPSLPFA